MESTYFLGKNTVALRYLYVPPFSLPGIYCYLPVVLAIYASACSTGPMGALIQTQATKTSAPMPPLLSNRADANDLQIQRFFGSGTVWADDFSPEIIKAVLAVSSLSPT